MLTMTITRSRLKFAGYAAAITPTFTLKSTAARELRNTPINNPAPPQNAMKRKRKRKKKETRTSPEGVRHGALMAKLADHHVALLIAEGEYDEDERCKSCAFRAGTVPNGCMQTQMDVMKAVLEKKPFACHVVPPGKSRSICAGWFAAVQSMKDREPSPCPWEFSPPDEQPTPARL